MTDTPRTIKAADCHPEIQAMFEAAQTEPVPVAATSPANKDTVILSKADFEDAIATACLKADEVKHIVVDRGDAPGAVIIEGKTFDNLATINTFFKDGADD